MDSKIEFDWGRFAKAIVGRCNNASTYDGRAKSRAELASRTEVEKSGTSQEDAWADGFSGGGSKDLESKVIFGVILGEVLE